MTNYQFLQTYVQLQKDIMFDEIFNLGFATICYCHNDSSSFWNNALVNTILTREEIEVVSSKLSTLERKPAFYFENRQDLQPFVNLLSQQGFKKEANDSIMIHTGENIDESLFGMIKKVESEKDLDVFLSVIDQCYRKDDPMNPYGELGEYINAARIAWIKHHNLTKVEYFIVYKNDTPVAVSTLTNHKQIGYISNVGSLISVRGEGFGKLSTMYCVSKSKKNGNVIHCLATEEGTNPNSFYKSIGFKTQFTSLLMSKSTHLSTNQTST